MTLLSLIRPVPRKDRLTRRQLPFTLGMILLDIAAPILLMLGLARAPAAHVSLLNNFEIVATSLFALLLFHERISRRVWCAIFLITAASMLLSFEGVQSLRFSSGSLLVLGACLCWGLENNCTRALSEKDPLQIVVVKGFGSDLKSRQEGIHYKNFFGTHLLGPLLIQNPPFTRYLLELLGVGRPLPFEQEVTEAYAYRLKEFHDPMRH